MLFDKNLTPHISVWGWSLTLFSRAFGRPTVVAKDHGIPESTISTWIARKVEVHPTCMTGSGGDSVIDETIVERFTEDQLDSAATYIAKVADVKDVSRPIRT